MEEVKEIIGYAAMWVVALIFVLVVKYIQRERN